MSFLLNEACRLCHQVRFQQTLQALSELPDIPVWPFRYATPAVSIYEYGRDGHRRRIHYRFLSSNSLAVLVNTNDDMVFDKTIFYATLNLSETTLDIRTYMNPRGLSMAPVTLQQATAWRDNYISHTNRPHRPVQRGATRRQVTIPEFRLN